MKKSIFLSFIALFLAACFMSQPAFALDKLRVGEFVRDWWVYDNSQTETNKGIAVDSQGNIYVASSKTATPPPPPLPIVVTPVDSENHIIKYNKTGDVLWDITFPPVGAEAARLEAILVDTIFTQPARLREILTLIL